MTSRCEPQFYETCDPLAADGQVDARSLGPAHLLDGLDQGAMSFANFRRRILMIWSPERMPAR